MLLLLTYLEDAVVDLIDVDGEPVVVYQVPFVVEQDAVVVYQDVVVVDQDAVVVEVLVWS